MLWNVFCKVIDNHGDIGVCWRLGADLASRAEQVRLWIDDASALRWMAPPGHCGIEVRRWDDDTCFSSDDVGDVLIEAFSCEIPSDFIALHGHAGVAKRIWINLQYLSAEAASGRNHGLASPVPGAVAAGLDKYFFYPGFQADTGGLLRESGLAGRQRAFNAAQWLQGFGIERGAARLISLFCYEPSALPGLLTDLALRPDPTRLLVTAGRATAAVHAAIGDLNGCNPAWNQHQALKLTYLPLLSQSEFDHLLWSCDVNFVRGEDSLVRALWAGRPVVWHIYRQNHDAHHAKLQAWLDWLQAPPSLRAFHDAWNARTDAPLPALDEAHWAPCFEAMRTQLLQQTDLCTRLLNFIAERR